MASSRLLCANLGKNSVRRLESPVHFVNKNHFNHGNVINIRSRGRTKSYFSVLTKGGIRGERENLQSNYICNEVNHYDENNLIRTKLPTRMQNMKTKKMFSHGKICDKEGGEEMSLLDIIQKKVLSGELKPDSQQERAAKRLSKLQKALQNYDNRSVIKELELEKQNQLQKQKELESETKTKERSDDSSSMLVKQKKEIKESQRVIHNPSSVRKSTHFEAKETLSNFTKVPRGIYLYGKVGTGKSMLMDLFYSATSNPRKRRVHFHSFMQDVHQRIHSLKQQDLMIHGRNFTIDTSQENNAIVRVALQLASEVTVLCFDEFQVTDVADALILSQLFSTLFQNGTVIVATSNRPPSDLYEGGINRSYFVPFIDILTHYCIQHNMNASIDYRRLNTSNETANYFFTTIPKLTTNSSRIISSSAFLETFDELFGNLNLQETTLYVAFNRTIRVRNADLDGLVVAKFTFVELCNINSGASDYRVIAQTYSAIVIEDIPYLSLKEHDKARRFITLVDELYEADCALLCSAAANPDKIFLEENSDSKARGENISSLEMKLGRTLGIDVAQPNGTTVGQLASVRELRFAFRRAASRLTEMCSKSWWKKKRLI